MAATIINALVDIDHPIGAMAAPIKQNTNLFRGIIAALARDCDSRVAQKTHNS
jgi:hypothetical protein